MTPSILTNEMENVENEMAKQSFDNFAVKTAKALSEVTASYEKDDFKLTSKTFLFCFFVFFFSHEFVPKLVVLQLPASYPLKAVVPNTPQSALESLQRKWVKKKKKSERGQNLISKFL